MPAIKVHKTKVDKSGEWDGPRAVADAPNDEATLRYMHAWYAGSNPEMKSSYKFPHHHAGTDTPAVIAAVNNALARLSQADIPAEDRAGVEAHLRRHRRDAGLEEAMSEAEIAEAVKFIKKMNDLKAPEAAALMEAVRLQERANLGMFILARMHGMMTGSASEMLGGGNITRAEHKALVEAAGMMMDVCEQHLKANAPQLFARRPWDEAPEAVDGGSAVNEAEDADDDGIDLCESGDGMFMPLIERAVRSDGTIPVKIIQPGWGSSGYYPADVLERDGPKIFVKGTKMFWNHPTPTEEAERPEGDLNQLAGEFVTTARYLANGPAGAGLYADAKVFEAYKKAVDDLAPHIGVSIRASGRAKQGEAEGKEGPIITELIARKSVDFVTAPGAGGQIVSMFEAARPHPRPLPIGVPMERGRGASGAAVQRTTRSGDLESNPMKEARMDELQLTQLQEANAALQTTLDEVKANNARMQEALALRDAKDMVREALSASTLPDVTKARLIEALSMNPPMKDGSLDGAAFKKRIEEAVKAEVQYLETVLGKGQIRGLGESQYVVEEGDDASRKAEAALTEAFTDLGWSKSGAKIAARGRG